MALSTSILPYISFKGSQTADGKREIKNSFFLLWYVILPVTLGLLSISLPLFKFLYPNFNDEMLSYAIRLMAVGSISTIVLAISQYYASILQAKGRFRTVLVSQLIGAVGKIFCTIFLCGISTINIFGIAIGNMVFSGVIMIVCLFHLKNDIFIGLKQFFIPLIGSGLMLGVIWYFSSLNLMKPIFNLVICIAFGVLIYILATFPFLKVLMRDFFGKKNARRNHE